MTFDRQAEIKEKIKDSQIKIEDNQEVWNRGIGESYLSQNVCRQGKTLGLW